MKKLLIAASLLFVFNFTAQAQTVIRLKESRSAGGKAERQVLQTLKDWSDAYIARDFAVLDRVRADEWIYSGAASGEIVTKAQADGQFKNGNYRYESFEFEDIDVRVFENTAIVTGRETIKLRRGAEPATAVKLRFTDVFVKRNNQWRAVLTHSSPITSGGDGGGAK